MPLSFTEKQSASINIDARAAADAASRAVSEAMASLPQTGKRFNSGRPLPHLATRIFNTPLLIRSDKAEIILGAIGSRLGIAADSLPVVAYYDDEEGDGLGYTVENRIATIPIHGVLVKRAGGMDALSGMTSYEQITSQIQKAMADDDVQGILLDVDSPGGESSGMFDLCDLIHGLRGSKPVFSCSNDSMYSAAYALGSCADQVYVTREGGVGSIGCYMLHCDQSGYDKQVGTKYTYIYAGDHKVDANPHSPLSAGALADLQSEVNYCRDMFVTLVARNRNCTAQQIIDLQARCLTMGSAPGPIPLLADKVGNLAAARADLMTKLGIDPDDDLPCDPDDPECPDNPDFKAALASALASAPSLADAVSVPYGGKAFYFSREGKRLKARVEALPPYDMQKEAEAFLAAVSGLTRDQYGIAHMFADAKTGYASVAKEDKSAPSLELRCGSPGQKSSAAADSRKITCCVAPYEQASTDMGGFVEIYSRGCFKKSLESNDDARVLFNHNSDMVLGRRSAGTARFYEQADGLYFEVDAPETQWADDLLTSMRRGDITGGSCAFFMKARWEYRSGIKTRVIEEARLVEGSVASFPIYETSTATAAPVPLLAAETLEFDQARLTLLRLR